MPSDVMEVSALGRPFVLGMFYDAVQHKLIPGVTLWDKKTLDELTVESTQHSSAFEISTSDSINDKSFLLDVDASLKASFLSGLVEVEGSAKYLNDKKKFHHQSRVTLQYKVTTCFKQLLITHPGDLDIQQEDCTRMGSATHVVTGILYGANAFLVFDSDKLDASNMQEIHGGMKAVIKKIPDFDIDGKVDINLTDKEKTLTDNLSCKYYGDFILESNPATFEKAVKTYINLPMLLGENKENVLPLKVWLMPLNYLDSSPPQQLTEISVGLTRRFQNALEDLRQLDKRCNELLEHKVVTHFPKIHEMLGTFQTLCTLYASILQQMVAKKLPLIKLGKEDENGLEQFLEDRHKSPFNQNKLIKWMEYKEKEINVISYCVDMMEGTRTTIVPNQSELDREVLDPGVEHVLCFSFTSVETAEPYLQELADYIDPLKLCGTAGVTPPEEDHWCSSDEVVADMREKAKAFHVLAEALKNNSRFRFLMAIRPNKTDKGANIYHYKDGILITDDFSKPELPPVETIKDKSALIWYTCALNLDPDTANHNLILSEGNKKATHGELQTYPVVPKRFDHFHQVLCKEGLTGRCYWEVEWSAARSEDVAVGVAYEGIHRKGKDEWCRLGWNVMSWCLGQRWCPPTTTLYAEHNNKCKYHPIPSTGCTTLGVYLDWPGGTLSFYKVSSNTLHHLHTFQAEFNEPVYPAFMIWREGNYVFLRI